MAAGALAFSVMSALAKVAGDSLAVFDIVMGRSLVVALLAGAAIRRRGHSFRPSEPGLLVVRALFGFCALSTYFYSVIHLPLADATVIYFTNPVLTAIAAAVLIGESMGRKEIALVVLSLAGVGLVARPSFLFGAAAALDPLAVTVGLASAVFGAGSYVTIRKIQRDPPLLVVFYFAVITVILAAPLVLPSLTMPSASETLLLVGIGVATHLGQLWVTWGFRLERAGRAAAVGYLQIVFAAVWGWLLFEELPDAWTWVGAGVIVVSTYRLVRLHPVR